MATDEPTRMNVPANDYRGWRAVGGRIAITDRAVVFEPNWIDYAAGARGWRIPLEGILSTTILPRHWSINPYKVQRRLRIEAKDRAPVIIRVTDPDLVADLLTDHS